jgi:TM2 domain-containing membrane protein YozV
MEGNFMERRVNKYFFVVFGAWMLGLFGGDRYLRGQIAFGILKCITLGALGIWYIVDLIIALTKIGKYEKDFEFVNGVWK